MILAMTTRRSAGQDGRLYGRQDAGKMPAATATSNLENGEEYRL
jgi:hypothetical protein